MNVAKFMKPENNSYRQKKSLLENTNGFDRRQNFILQEKKCKRMLYFAKKAFDENNLIKLS